MLHLFRGRGDAGLDLRDDVGQKRADRDAGLVIASKEAGDERHQALRRGFDRVKVVDGSGKKAIDSGQGCLHIADVDSLDVDRVGRGEQAQGSRLERERVGGGKGCKTNSRCRSGVYRGWKPLDW